MLSFCFHFVSVCYLRPVKDRPTKYFNDVFKVEQDCPPGTVFMADICVCGLSLKISRNIPVTLYSNGEHQKVFDGITNYHAMICVFWKQVHSISQDTKVCKRRKRLFSKCFTYIYKTYIFSNSKSCQHTHKVYIYFNIVP